MCRYEYPVDHPILRYDVPVDQINELFGIAKVTVLPPKTLLHPVLPYRTDKLLFPLCRTCADLRQCTPCHHKDGERMIEGTYTTVEILKAIKMGYELIAIHQVYHFQAKSKNLFDGYMKTFLKMKYEASGWGEELSEEEKNAKIAKIRETDGIEINKDKVQDNPGLRTIAKLLLNSVSCLRLSNFISFIYCGFYFCSYGAVWQ